MSVNKEERISEIENLMSSPNFWGDKDKAQEIVKEYNQLKEVKAENYPAVVSIIAGSGGDDAEDFASMLAGMYQKYAENKGMPIFELSKHQNDKGGYKNISLEIEDKRAYTLLKHESGVHRLVRISPFNSKKQRHTSFALVDVIPKLPEVKDTEIPPKDLEISFSNSSGPGGQNVNKRETAVRVKHIPTNISVKIEDERSQVQNKERALEILRGRLFSLMKKNRLEKLGNLSHTKGLDIDWGNQVRSYVLHPYKLVKDLRVDYEERDPDEVFKGEIDGFISALSNLK